MRDEELYQLLKGPEDRPTEWARAADQFLRLKEASVQQPVGMSKKAGPEYVDSSMDITPEQAEGATRSGMLSGLRSQVSGDMARAESVRRKRGESLGKVLGMISGGTGGAFAGRSLGGAPGSVVGMAAGALGGHALGKTIGSEVDRKRMLSTFQPKEASAPPIVHHALGVVRHEETPHIHSYLLGNLPLDQIPTAEKELLRNRMGRHKESEMEKEAPKVASVRAMLRKKAAASDSEPTMPIQAPPAGGMGGGAPEASALDEFLQAQQQANEAEFFRQQAESAGAQLEQLQEHAGMLEQQNQQLQQQNQQVQMETQQQAQMAQQSAQTAQAESQMAQQDAMAARDESLQAQQQTLEIRDAVTRYRQQLMDLLSQDPMSMLGPPTVPTGPAPMPPAPGASPDQGQAPQEAQGGPPGQEQGGGPSPEMQAPPDASGVVPEVPGQPPQPQAPQGGGSPVTVNVKAPKPEKPKQPAQSATAA